MIKLARSQSITYLLLLTILGVGIMVLPIAAVASEYTHNSPAFKVTFPDNWNIMPSIYENQILFVQDPSGNPQLHLSVSDISAGDNLANACERYQEALKVFGPTATIISDKEIKLQNGTPACESVFKWNWGGVAPMNSLVIMAIRNNKQITIGIHTPGELGEVEKKIASSVWIAGEKTFEHKEPSYSVTYPENYKPLPFVSENQVLRVRCGLGTLDSTIADLPENAKLEDSGKVYENTMKSLPVASEVRLVSSKQTKLKNGAPAALNALEWKWNTLPIRTLSLTTYKDNKAITTSVHSWYMGIKGWDSDYEKEAKAILDSMELR